MPRHENDLLVHHLRSAAATAPNGTVPERTTRDLLLRAADSLEDTEDAMDEWAFNCFDTDVTGVPAGRLVDMASWLLDAKMWDSFRPGSTLAKLRDRLQAFYREYPETSLGREKYDAGLKMGLQVAAVTLRSLAQHYIRRDDALATAENHG